MRVPLSWLKDFVDINQSVKEVDSTLTNAGLEVKTIDYIGIPGAELEWDRNLIVLGHILKVEQHPNADKLVLATVEYGADTPETVVTGAPNLYQYVGMGDISHLQLYSPLALEGAQLYDGHKAEPKKVKLKGRELRGIYNKAMLCSEKELGISDEHEGIIIMQKDEWSPDYVAGTPLQDVLGDAVLEIDIIPNIARCASIVGVAREYAALTNQPLRQPDYNVVIEGEEVPGGVELSTENPELNPRFVAIVIKGIEQKQSPYWMQYRLRQAGQRPINVVVDISNYVMLEMGQPNHTFDFDFLRQRADQYAPNGPVHIHTRLPHEGETLRTLDGEIHELKPINILVTDPLGNLSLGGVMGGYDSEIKETTTNVLLEAAAWNFINIRRTANQLGVHTEAAFRFSRGVHPSQAMLGAKRAAELLRRLAGGTVHAPIYDYYPMPPEPVSVTLKYRYARQLSGLDLTGEEMAALLRRLEFEVTTYDDHLVAVTPDHRMDIEGPHDLVEEICRVYGYGRIPSTVLSDTLPPQRGNPALEQEMRIKDILVGAGLNEIITYRMTSPEREAKLFPNGEIPWNANSYVTITNPNSPERRVMRHSLLSSALEIATANSRYQERIAIFETGHIYMDSPDQVLPDELPRLAVVLTGRRDPEHWQNNQPSLMDFYDLKGLLEHLLETLHVDAQFEPANHPTYRPGRTARLVAGDTEIGVLGELHPLVVEAFDMRVEREQPVLAAELDMAALIEAIPFAHAYQPISPYPAVREDLALVMDEEIPAAAVTEVIKRAGGALLTAVELFDVYRGGNIPAGQKSLAYHLTFQSQTKTLNDKVIKKNRQRILKQLERELNIKLR
jgi:phenylalanyl-tRNA synthetase beta chain